MQKKTSSNRSWKKGLSKPNFQTWMDNSCSKLCLPCYLFWSFCWLDRQLRWHPKSGEKLLFCCFSASNQSIGNESFLKHDHKKTIASWEPTYTHPKVCLKMISCLFFFRWAMFFFPGGNEAAMKHPPLATWSQLPVVTPFFVLFCSVLLEISWICCFQEISNRTQWTDP